MNTIPPSQLMRVCDVWNTYHWIDSNEYYAAYRPKAILRRYKPSGEQLGRSIGKNSWQPSVGLHRDNIKHIVKKGQTV